MTLQSLPANLDAERSVLGAIVLDNAAYEPAAKVLLPDDFSHGGNGRIFARMGALAGAGKPIDPVLLTEELVRSGELDAVGGVPYLTELTGGLPRSVNVAFYVQIVRDKAERRRLMNVAQKVAAMAADPAADPAEIREVVSAYLEQGVRAERNLRFETAEEIEDNMPAEVEWVARPWVAAGSITELVGKVKVAGKTTWALTLCRAVLAGLPFLGEPTRKGPVVYLTEQNPASFRVAMERAGLLGRADFVVLHWKATVGWSWPTVAREATAECKRRGAGLLVVDTLPQFAKLIGDSENNAGDALAAIQPVQLAARHGVGVVVVRHERKAGGQPGDSGRGSSAFGGAVDTILSLQRGEGNRQPTIRVIRGLSRFTEVPDELVIELTAQGYQAIGTPGAVAAEQAEATVMRATPDSEGEAVKLDELCTAAGLHRTTGQRAVEALLGRAWLKKTGLGKRGDPFRYYRAPFDRPT